MSAPGQFSVDGNAMAVRFIRDVCDGRGERRLTAGDLGGGE